jgi:hypothetical protein
VNTSLQNQLTAASTREQYSAILKITPHELATALCCLAHDEGLPQPFRIKFRDQNPVPWHEEFGLYSVCSLDSHDSLCVELSAG